MHTDTLHGRGESLHITTVEQVSAGNQHGCGDDNPYN
jgi:hypothetical protein